MSKRPLLNYGRRAEIIQNEHSMGLRPTGPFGDVVPKVDLFGWGLGDRFSLRPFGWRISQLRTQRPLRHSAEDFHLPHHAGLTGAFTKSPARPTTHVLGGFLSLDQRSYESKPHDNNSGTFLDAPCSDCKPLFIQRGTFHHTRNMLRFEETGRPSRIPIPFLPSLHR